MLVMKLFEVMVAGGWVLMCVMCVNTNIYEIVLYYKIVLHDFK